MRECVHSMIREAATTSLNEQNLDTDDEIVRIQLKMRSWEPRFYVNM